MIAKRSLRGRSPRFSRGSGVCPPGKFWKSRRSNTHFLMFWSILVNDSTHSLQEKVCLKYIQFSCVQRKMTGKWTFATKTMQIFCLDNCLPRTGTWEKAKRHSRNLNSTKEQREQAKSRFKIVFLGVDRDKTGRIGFFGSSGWTSGFGLQIGTVPTRSGRLASMLYVHKSAWYVEEFLQVLNFVIFSANIRTT